MINNEDNSRYRARDSRNSCDSASCYRSNMAQQFQETSAMHQMVKVQSLPAKEDKSILEARSRTFVNWINSILPNEVKNLDSDLESGVVLIKLLEKLAQQKLTQNRLVISLIITCTLHNPLSLSVKQTPHTHLGSLKLT